MTFEALVHELADTSHHVPAKKLAALSAMDSAAASSFLEVWREMPERRRTRLIADLVQLAEDNVELNFDPVFIIALNDESPDIRHTAIEGLWEYEARDLIAPLLGLLERDPDAGVRASAALALGRYVVLAEFDQLPSRDAERVESALRRTFGDPTEPVEVRGRALESLGARNNPWVSDLIDEAHASGDRRLEISAIHAMGRSADEAWLPAVTAQLESDDAEVRFEAAHAAGLIAEPDSVPLLRPLLHDEDTEVRMAAIDALGEIGGDDAKDALEELLAEGDERFTSAITLALAEINFANDPLALAPLDGA